MRVIRTVAFADVLETFRRERGDAGGSAPWTLRLLEQANAELGPDWRDIELTGLEAGAILLPRHAGEPCHGDRLTLVDDAGLTVAATALRFAGLEHDYRAANRSCWGRIDRARREPLSRIVVATAPLDHAEYRGLPRGAGLYHLDGLHRLIGWQLTGQLADTAIVRAHMVGAL